MDLLTMYAQMGLGKAVCDRGEEILSRLTDRFRAIDQRAEINQAKVLLAMQKNRIGAQHFAATTGYGYDDDGRERLRTSSTPRRRWSAHRSPAAPTP